MSIRLPLRDCVCGVLSCFPFSWFEAFRNRHQTASPGFRKRCLQGMLNVLRYRQPPASLESFIVEAGRPLHLANDGSWISRRLYWLGEAGYEPIVADLWRECCRHSTSVLEIGANIGYMTTQGATAAPEVKYCAVEPNPEAIASIRRNLSLNGLRNVAIVEAAVVGKSDCPTLALCIDTNDPHRAPAGARLGIVSGPTNSDRVIDVPVREAATLIDGVDALKIDAEGAELDILSSIQQQLGAQRTLILIEVLDRMPKLRTFLADFAARFNYVIAIATNPLTTIRPDSLPGTPLWSKFKTRDALLVPIERADVFGLR
jgi:FkbM family methyltransferase